MFDMRADRVGWTVYDVETGRPAVLEELVLVGLDHATADQLVGLLNQVIHRRPKKRNGT